MYQILRDYYSNGYSLDDTKYATVDEAVKAAISSGYSAPFLIIKVIEWKTTEI